MVQSSEASTYRRILVTGGNGLLRSALKSIQDDYPNREFIFSSSPRCDLTDLQAVLAHVGEIRPDAILHFAAVNGGIGLSIKYPATLLRDNVLMNLHVLEAARIHGVEKSVMSLSTGMYASDAPDPIREESIHDGPPHESVYGDAFAKRLVEPSIRADRTEFGLRVIGLVPNDLFGENANLSHEAAATVPALIRRYAESREGDSPIAIWEDGALLSECTYAPDLARASMWCLDHYEDERILHVGTTEKVSIRELASLIADLMAIDRNRIVCDASRPSGQPRTHTDNSWFVQLSNFRSTPFRAGLQRTVEWFSQQYEQREAVRLSHG